MDCLRSFNLYSQNTFAPNYTGPEVKTWTTGTQIFWSFSHIGQLSTFNIQGFKNVNVYGIELIGNVGTNVAAPSGGCIPTDWYLQIQVNGFVPIIGGSVVASPNFYNLSTAQSNVQLFNLGRFNSKFMLASPIESVSSIAINDLTANGTGGETLLNLNIQSVFNIVVYYKYEGE